MFKSWNATREGKLDIQILMLNAYLAGALTAGFRAVITALAGISALVAALAALIASLLALAAITALAALAALWIRKRTVSVLQLFAQQLGFIPSQENIIWTKHPPCISTGITFYSKHIWYATNAYLAGALTAGAGAVVTTLAAISALVTALAALTLQHRQCIRRHLELIFLNWWFHVYCNDQNCNK